MSAKNKCDKTFSLYKNLKIHTENIHEGVKYSCNQCEKVFNLRDNLRKHFRKEVWSQLIHVMMSQVAHAPLERDLETPDTYGKFFFKSLSLDIRVNNKHKPINNDALVVVALKCY